MNSANAGAGEHTDDSFQYHRHINGYSVTLANVPFTKTVGELAYQFH